jgi:DNA-binding CsgD family transcriptional regulator
MKRIKYVFGTSYLTPCEVDYVGLIIKGLSHPAISKKLGKSVHTIHTVRDKIFAKAGIDTRALLVGVAISAGFNPDGNHKLTLYKKEGDDNAGLNSTQPDLTPET